MLRPDRRNQLLQPPLYFPAEKHRQKGMILGIGIDILFLPRFSALVQRRSALALAKRICSPRELAEFPAEPDKQLRFLSTRWVAKEAAYKALPFSGVTWKALDLHHTAKGQPVLRHTSHASDTCDAVRLMLSISHDSDVVVGVVVALSAESE